eukprot:PhM_4_TR13413/c0_g1_i1/m.81449
MNLQAFNAANSAFGAAPLYTASSSIQGTATSSRAAVQQQQQPPPRRASVVQFTSNTNTTTGSKKSRSRTANHRNPRSGRRPPRVVGANDIKSALDNVQRVTDDLVHEQGSRNSIVARLDNVDYRDLNALADVCAGFVHHLPMSFFWLVKRGRILLHAVRVLQRAFRAWATRRRRLYLLLLAAWSLDEEYRDASEKPRKKSEGSPQRTASRSPPRRRRGQDDNPHQGTFLLDNSGGVYTNKRTDLIWKDHFKGWIPRQLKLRVLHDIENTLRAEFVAEHREYQLRRRQSAKQLREYRKAARLFDQPIRRQELNLPDQPEMFFATVVGTLSVDYLVRRAYRMDVLECADRVAVALKQKVPDHVIRRHLHALDMGDHLIHLKMVRSALTSASGHDVTTVRPPMEVFMKQIRSVTSIAPEMLEEMQKKGTVCVAIRMFKEQQAASERQARSKFMRRHTRLINLASMENAQDTHKETYYFGEPCTFKGCECKMLVKHDAWPMYGAVVPRDDLLLSSSSVGSPNLRKKSRAPVGFAPSPNSLRRPVAASAGPRMTVVTTVMCAKCGHASRYHNVDDQDVVPWKADVVFHVKRGSKTGGVAYPGGDMRSAMDGDGLAAATGVGNIFRGRLEVALARDRHNRAGHVPRCDAGWFEHAPYRTTGAGASPSSSRPGTASSSRPVSRSERVATPQPGPLRRPQSALGMSAMSSSSQDGGKLLRGHSSVPRRPSSALV